MATKKSTTDSAERIDPGLQELYDHIRLQCEANYKAIFKNEKPERLLKMLQTCPELKPVPPDNKELWRIVQKVRKEILSGGKKTRATKKTGKEG